MRINYVRLYLQFIKSLLRVKLLTFSRFSNKKALFLKQNSNVHNLVKNYIALPN